jgi:hypothetical protein
MAFGRLEALCQDIDEEDLQYGPSRPLPTEGLEESRSHVLGTER